MILAADRCQDRAPAIYVATSTNQLAGIVNPKLGDIVFVISATQFSKWVLIEAEDADLNAIDSNACEYMWEPAPIAATENVTIGIYDSGGIGGLLLGKNPYNRIFGTKDDGTIVTIFGLDSGVEAATYVATVGGGTFSITDATNNTVAFFVTTPGPGLNKKLKIGDHLSALSMLHLKGNSPDIMLEGTETDAKSWVMREVVVGGVSVFRLRDETSGNTIAEWHSDNGTYRPFFPIRLTDGTAALPSLSFANGSNLGLYRSTNDTLAITAAGAQVANFSPGLLTVGTDLFLRNGTAADVQDAAVDLGNDKVLVWRDNTNNFTACGFVWLDSINQLNFGTNNQTSARLDSNTTSGETRMLLWDGATSTLKRVKAGANGTGPGGVGRALYIDNI